MRELNTPQDVIVVTGVQGLENYFDVKPLNDAIGFSVKRYYPPDLGPARVVTAQGQPAVCALIQFWVEGTNSSGGVRPVGVYVRLMHPYGERHGRHFNFADPDCPTPESLALLNQMEVPLQLEFNDEFLYDIHEEQYYGLRGPLTPREILDYVFDYHCRTLRLAFRLKWKLRLLIDRTLQKATWGLHDVFMRILEQGYGIRLKVPPHRWPTLFPKYGFNDFEKISTSETSHFFGFQSSKGALFTNLIVMAGAFIIAYWILPRTGIVRVIYRNPGLTTAALVFVFLLTDQVVPFFLKLAVCGLARLKRYTIFITRRVVV